MESTASDQRSGRTVYFPCVSDTPESSIPVANSPSDKKGSRAADFERLCGQVVQLSVRERVRLFDALAEHDGVERPDGVKFSVRSLTEFKRFGKSKPADEPILDWIRSFGPEDVFFDIGANTGALSLVAGVAHQGRVPVYAFEPAFDNFESLVRNIFANRLEHVVTPLQVALLDHSGLQPFYYKRRGAGSAMHAAGEALDYLRLPFEAAAVQPVMAFSLDDLTTVLGLPRPTRIKIDVDGFEHKVIAGATRVLTSGSCDLLVEVVQRDVNDTHSAVVMSDLERLGFVLVSSVERRPVGTFPRAQDVLFRRE